MRSQQRVSIKGGWLTVSHIHAGCKRRRSLLSPYQPLLRSTPYLFTREKRSNLRKERGTQITQDVGRLR